MQKMKTNYSRGVGGGKRESRRLRLPLLLQRPPLSSLIDERGTTQIESNSGTGECYRVSVELEIVGENIFPRGL